MFNNFKKAKQNLNDSFNDFNDAVKVGKFSLKVGVSVRNTALKLYSKGGQRAIDRGVAKEYYAASVKAADSLGQGASTKIANLGARTIATKAKIRSGYRMVYGKIRRVKT